MLDHVTVDDIDLYYQTAGDGPAIALLHGFGGNHLSWWQQFPTFAETYRCIAPDQRMFGLSAAETDRNAVAAFVDDLESLLDHLGVDRAVLVGHSMSGWPVASFATQFPDRVAALVLSATPGGLISPERHQELMEEGAESLPDVDPLTAEEEFLADSISELNRYAPAEWTDVRPVLDELPIDADRIVDAGIPAFLIAGEADAFMPGPAVEAVSERLDGCEYAIVEGAGHSSNFDRPEAFNELVKGFVDEHHSN